MRNMLASFLHKYSLVRHEPPPTTEDEDIYAIGLVGWVVAEHVTWDKCC